VRKMRCMALAVVGFSICSRAMRKSRAGFALQGVGQARHAIERKLGGAAFDHRNHVWVWEAGLGGDLGLGLSGFQLEDTPGDKLGEAAVPVGLGRQYGLRVR
jgi:hypothetical protein